MTACGGSGPDLDSLKNDPVSGIALPDAQLVDRFEQPRSLGASGDKANPAQIILSFAVRPGADERALLGSVARMTSSAGWAAPRRTSWSTRHSAE